MRRFGTKAASVLIILLLAAAFAASFAVPFSRVHESRAKALRSFPPSAFMGNDGAGTTSFGLHMNPHFIFSEDFHLYYVRTARSLRFGFPANILEPSRSERRDFRNIIQTAVTAIPALWGERLTHYALIYFFYILAALLIALYAARLLVRDPFTALIIAAALLISIGPRSLRISTTLLSFPVFLTGMAFLTLLLRDFLARGIPGFKEMRGVFTLLLILALWDVWSFLLMLFSTVFVFLWISLKIAAGPGTAKIFSRGGDGVRKASLFLLRSFSGLFFAGAVYWLVSGSSSRDILERAGFFNAAPPSLQHLLPGQLFLQALAAAFILLLVRKRSHIVFQFFLLFAAAASALLIAVIYFFRLEAYQLSHFYLLIRHAVFWLCITGLAYPGYATLHRRWTRLRGRLRLPDIRLRPLKLMIRPLQILLICWMIFSVYRFFDTVFKNQFAFFSIPSSYESALEFIEANYPEQKRRRLLTLSHEANHLLAYHTDFDLLLPEGFPLHSNLDHADLMDRMAEISRFLGISIQAWNAFLQPQHANDQIVWMASRVHSESQGYLYYLFHRYSLRPDFVRDKKQAAKLKEGLLKHIFISNRTLREKPEFILAEGVFRLLQASVPPGYELVFSSGDIVLYKLEE